MQLTYSKKTDHKTKRRIKIKARIRQKLNGTAERPRIAIFRSNTKLYAQCVEDAKGVTLVGLNSAKVPACKGKVTCESAFEFGKEFGKKLSEKGITQAVFDRSGYLYHGRIKQFSEGIRKSGIKF
jgi:large subunit ribosomal protein L18